VTLVGDLGPAELVTLVGDLGPAELVTLVGDLADSLSAMPGSMTMMQSPRKSGALCAPEIHNSIAVPQRNE
jgi:hypothetical protein